MMMLFGYGGGGLGLGDRLGVRRGGGLPGGWFESTDAGAKARAKRDLENLAAVEVSDVFAVWSQVVAGHNTAAIFESGTDGLPWLGVYFTSLDGSHVTLTKLSRLV